MDQAGDSDDADSVKAALNAFIAHFSQPIHCETLPDETAPYFDELLGRPMPSLRPVTQHCLIQLNALDDPTVVAIEWLRGYGQHVRPYVKQDDAAPIPPSAVRTTTTVLQQYESILSKLTRKKTSSLKSGESQGGQFLSETLQLLAQDISDWTARTAHLDERSASERKSVLHLVSNLLLPMLLQLLYHTMQLSGGISASRDLSVFRESTVSLLAFGMPRLDPRSLSPITIGQAFSHLKYRMFDEGESDVFCEMPLGDDEWVGWEKLALDGTAWDDPRTGIASRAARRCWEAMLPRKDVEGEHDEVDKSRVIQSLETLHVAEAVRAAFFGRTNQAHRREVAASSTRIQPKNYPLALTNGEPVKEYKRRAGRIHSALHFISLLQNPSSSILTEVLPICYELLEGASYEAVAAAAIVHLLNTQSDRDEWSSFEETLLSVLTLAVSRRGAGVAFAALAQSRAFDMFSDRLQARRKATHELLAIIHRKAQNETDPDGTVTALMLCGAIPLLQQHADEQTADALELGRLGLDTLLPLLRWDGVPRIQLAGLVALQALLLGAYPIMPRHGGAQMCEVLACLGHTSRLLSEGMDSSQKIHLRKAVLAVGIQVGAFVAFICGEKASAVLDQVERDGTYEPILVEHANSVRSLVQESRDNAKSKRSITD